MPKLIPLKQKDMISKLSKLWYKWPFPWGKHPVMVKETHILTVLNTHGNKTIAVWIISTILKQISVDRDIRIDL